MTVQELKSTFNCMYQKEPMAVYFAPGHVNLIGEHIQYDDYGKPSCLSYGIYLLLCKNEDKCIRFWSLNEPDAVRVELNQLSTTINKTWIQYPVNVFAQYIKLGVKITDGFDTLIWGNIPKNATISSQNALKVITAYALDNQFDTKFIHNIVEKIGAKENYEFKLVNCEIMTQFVVANYLQYDTFQLLFNSAQRNFLSEETSDVKIVISNTHTPHKLEVAPYKQRIIECKQAVEKLNSSKSFKSEKTLTPGDINTTELSDKHLIGLKRFSHVLGEVQRSADGVKALKEGDLNLFGRLMNASHISLRDNYDIVSLEVDLMVTEAWKIEGVIGSRMTGGGFGGCTVSLVKNEAIDTFIEITGSIYEKNTGIKPQFFIADIGDCACKLN